MNSMKLLAVKVLMCLLITTAIKPVATFKLLNSTEPQRGNSCVKRIQHLANGEIIVECNRVSFACLSSIPKHGFPMCEAVFSRRTIKVGETTRSEKVITHCTCV